MQFTSSYVYSGTAFSGDPEMVACAEAGETLIGNCDQLTVCVVEGSTTKTVVMDHLDGLTTNLVSSHAIEALVTGECNVMAGDTISLYTEQEVREAGYTGEYIIGSKLLSKEPLSMVTRGNDPEFADFVQWTLNALLAAEVMNITQETAEEFPTTDLFGPQYRKMSSHAISAVGNFGELYERHFKGALAGGRTSLVTLSDDVKSKSGLQSGLQFAPPFGNLDIEEVLDKDLPSAVVNGTIEAIENRNYLQCAVLVSRPWLNIEDDLASGIDVEFCRALTAAMFKGNVSSSQLQIVAVATLEEGFDALNSGNVDVFASTPYTMTNDVKEPSTGMGFTLSPPYFYGRETSEIDGRMVLTGYSLATRQDDSQWSDFVRWAVWSTIHAEEIDVESPGLGASDLLPTVDLFGPNYVHSFRYVNLAVGHYGEMYQRSQEEFIPREDFGGYNQLSQGGPLLKPWLSSFFM